ncbi:hypothetical protein ACIQCJ_02195 [Streptomyces sp. NPDC093221]|uniref:hypothetical protein n=1 Tax=Streptomyces sp. NPDC093221 TaxID=3366032 RepID=UPI0037F78FBA
MTRRKAVDHDDPATPIERLDVKPSVQRKLFMLSGNECAWAKCRQVLVPADGGWFGEIAHIRAAEEGGPRADKTMTNNERRAFENLLLLCAKHHQLIDDTETRHRYSRTFLEGVKRRHESRYERALDDFGRNEQEFVDHTHANVVTHCSTLLGFYGTDFLTEEERLDDVPAINKIADQLGRVTLAARQLLCLVVEHDSQLGVAEAANRGGISKQKVRDLVDELQRLSLAYINPTPRNELDPGEVRERIIAYDSGHDHPVFDHEFWQGLCTYVADHPSITLDDIIVGLDFSLLD